MMDAQAKRRVLVVANRTAATPQLLETVRARRQRGPSEFALLIPDVTDRKRADWTLETAVPLLEREAGGPVEALVGGEDPFASVQEAVRDGGFDEVIVSTLPRKTSKWLRRDLIRRVAGLGLPVTAVVPDDGMTNKKALKQMMDGAASGGGMAGGVGGPF
jgi:hypothetical protein